MTAVTSLVGESACLRHEWESRHRHFAPPPRLTLSQWADRYRMLSSESSDEQGRWRTDWFPPMREIMDCITDPVVERVSFQKPAQVGWTELIGNMVGYIVDLDPGPTLVVQPSQDDARMWSKERFDPLLRDTPRLHGKIHYGNRREKDQSILRKTFPGGFIAIVGAHSARGLRARPVRYLIGDERDAYPQSARGSAKRNAGGDSAGEGDPWSLAMKRTTRFLRRKILEGSTPTVKGVSAIERARQQGSDAEFYVPCPMCSYAQTLKWSNVRWESGQPETATYLCGEIGKDGELLAGCGNHILPHLRQTMLLGGQWVHKHPERLRWRSYLINGIYALPWPALAQEFLETKGNREDLKVFVNTRLAETWDDSGERVSESELEARRGLGGYCEKNPPTYDVPVSAAVLVAGVDTQGDRLEVSVWAYGTGEQAWLLEHTPLYGSPAASEVWSQLDALLVKPYRHASGAILHIRCMAIDSGGHHHDEVCRYARARRRKNVWAVRGVGGEGIATLRPPLSKSKSKERIWSIGSNAMKDTLFARLQIQTAGPNYLNFPHAATVDYFGQLTAERRVTTYIRGKPTRHYVLPAGKRNEALDCAQYALAALYILGPVRDRLQLEVKKLEPTPKADELSVKQAEPVSVLSQLRRPTQARPRGFVNRW